MNGYVAGAWLAAFFVLVGFLFANFADLGFWNSIGLTIITFLALILAVDIALGGGKDEQDGTKGIRGYIRRRRSPRQYRRRLR